MNENNSTANSVLKGSCTPMSMVCIGLAGKGDHVMQNPGGQMDRPVNIHFLERSVHIFYTVFGGSEVNGQMKDSHSY